MPHTKVCEIIENLDVFHHTFYQAAIFNGPSLHFHTRALETRLNCEAFTEASYAMLAAWGMHRMGPGGSKMKDFGAYRSSLEEVWDMICDASHFNISQLHEAEWLHLKEIFVRLKVMESETSLVGNSKVMAHALPHLIPPVDRQYTLAYLCGNKNIQNNKEKEWITLRELISSFFEPVVSNALFQHQITTWTLDDFPWDTSPLKVVDNLLIGAVRASKKGND